MTVTPAAKSRFIGSATSRASRSTVAEIVFERAVEEVSEGLGDMRGRAAQGARWLAEDLREHDLQGVAPVSTRISAREPLVKEDAERPDSAAVIDPGG
ncbi:Hypothetical protein CAP_0997 [Chondromyces apiculatus DSM 436]|uniref:Uncharacterized protein n=1 Tax=Chondromyces apiculatus DSM 436 TaxID=1192034 RepID=A0A017STE1_9BACT|nr:Hypothetical protein CAP_0997 [Chondromyces apiculatus DSM 436]